MTNNLIKKISEKPQLKKININAIIEEARSIYGKKEQGLAKQIATGSTLSRPEKDSDFILWRSNNFWKSLTGLKGIPYGKTCSVSGKSDSGKSSCALKFMQEAQEQGAAVILWDSERKFGVTRFRDQMKGNVDELLVVDTSSIIEGAKAVAYLVNAVKKQNIDQPILIVWDSVGASINSTESNEDNAEEYSRQPGVTAKEVAFAIRKFNKLMNTFKNKETGQETIAVLAINQTYSSIGMGAPTQIDKGGTTIYYLSSLIIQLSRKKDLIKVKSGIKTKHGIISRAKVKKNHLFQDSTDSVSEMDIVVTADGVNLAEEIKKDKEVSGWDDPEENESDE